jgi:hypothetical protein
MDKVLTKIIILLSLSCVLLISCKDSKSKEEEEIGTEFPAEFQKVWQDDESILEGDELGIYFTDTKIVFWDYDGDDFDQGDDCFYVFEAGTLVSYEGDNYTVSIIDPETQGQEQISAEITINNGKLIIDDPEESEPITHTDTGDSISDLSPVCSDQAAKRVLRIDKSALLFKNLTAH